ncbi:MAG: hypothetical protein BroJett030_03410 [Alphaproteobacteria bacterium]|nr:MAG: hypothetical protein BroJett030_03410 [Alphaproteobacteria bacterium]
MKKLSTVVLIFVAAVGQASAAEVVMPNLIGKTRTQAEALLNTAGIKFEALRGQRCVAAADDIRVFGQKPDPGTKFSNDFVATFLLPAAATGNMPELVGLSCAAVEAFREEHGMGGNTFQINLPPDKVISRCNRVTTSSSITEQSIEVGAPVCDRLSLFATCTHRTLVDKTWIWNGSSCIGL